MPKMGYWMRNALWSIFKIGWEIWPPCMHIYILFSDLTIISPAGNQLSLIKILEKCREYPHKLKEYSNLYYKCIFKNTHFLLLSNLINIFFSPIKMKIEIQYYFSCIYTWDNKRLFTYISWPPFFVCL